MHELLHRIIISFTSTHPLYGMVSHQTIVDLLPEFSTLYEQVGIFKYLQRRYLVLFVLQIHEASLAIGRVRSAYASEGGGGVAAPGYLRYVLAPKPAAQVVQATAERAPHFHLSPPHTTSSITPSRH